MSEEQIVISRKEKPNSFEFGEVGNRFKLYFDDADDLELQIEQLKKLNHYKEE